MSEIENPGVHFPKRSKDFACSRYDGSSLLSFMFLQRLAAYSFGAVLAN